MTRQCVECGAAYDPATVKLGDHWCRPCDKARVHRISVAEGVQP